MDRTRGSQLLPRVFEILVILASKYMDLMGDSRASVRDSALILASVAAPSGSQVLYLRNQILRYLINYWFVIADILRRIFLLLMFSLFISMVSLLRGITIISKRLPRSTTSYSTDWPFQSEYICVTPDPYIGIALHRPRKKGRERREDKTERLQAKEIWIWNPDLTGRRTALHVSGDIILYISVDFEWLHFYAPVQVTRKIEKRTQKTIFIKTPCPIFKVKNA